jgi:hypothetical protein
MGNRVRIQAVLCDIIRAASYSLLFTRPRHSSVRVTAEVCAHSPRGQDDEAMHKLEEFQRASRSAAGVTSGGVGAVGWVRKSALAI